MAPRGRSRRVEDELAALAAHRADPTSVAAVEAMRRALDRGPSFVVAAAAAMVAEADIEALAPLLAPAFHRLVDDGAARDPGCRAKIALVEALCRLGRDEGDVFLRAVRLRQPEASWGPPVDTAATLRAHAAMGLASMRHPDAAVELARLLADSEWIARSGAARALALVPEDAALPVLCLKALAGDPEAEVVGDCFRSLLALAPQRSLDLVAERLDRDDAVSEQAALALGDSRLDGAFARLRAWVEAGLASRRRVGLLAIALLRSDAGKDYLLATLADGDRPAAAHALEALAVYKHDVNVRARVLAAAAARGDAALVDKAHKLLQDA